MIYVKASLSDKWNVWTGVQEELIGWWVTYTYFIVRLQV